MSSAFHPNLLEMIPVGRRQFKNLFLRRLRLRLEDDCPPQIPKGLCPSENARRKSGVTSHVAAITREAETAATTTSFSLLLTPSFLPYLLPPLEDVFQMSALLTLAGPALVFDQR